MVCFEFKREWIMSKSKKAKREGLEKHRQMLREKKLKLKAKKQVSLPKKHRGKKWNYDSIVFSKFSVTAHCLLSNVFEVS